MIYSCAYFEDAQEDLNQAQRHKLEYICRKLRLKPGEHLLDMAWSGVRWSDRLGVIMGCMRTALP